MATYAVYAPVTFDTGAGDPATYTGTGTVTLPALTVAGVGTFAAPTYAGSGAVSLPALTAAGAGSFAPPVYQGSGAATLPGLTANGVGTFAVPPGIAIIDAPATGERYRKAEWTFALDKTYANPCYPYDAGDTPAANPATQTWFGADGVTVDLVLTAPDAATVTVPCFWEVPQARALVSGIEVLGASGPGRWVARFAPEQVGDYQWFLRATDAVGTGRYPASGTNALTSAETGDKGFIRVSPADPRFLAYSDGSPYIPIASGRQYWDNDALKSHEYDTFLADAGANGVNLLRPWSELDSKLAVEGAQPIWVREGTTAVPALGVAIGAGSANVRSGMRAAKPAAGAGWYQRVVVGTPGVSHRLSAWIKTGSLSGTASVTARTGGITFNGGTLRGTAGSPTGTTAWTEYTVDFTPTASPTTISLLVSGTGDAWFDDLAFGPLDGGAIAHNILNDPDFERHFGNDLTGNDPDADPALERPIGTYVNQWAAAELDAIVAAAESAGVAFQLLSGSGPWFTWPLDPDAAGIWDEWWLRRHWERNYRYRIARWGYSTSVLAWELINEHGHVADTSETYAFYRDCWLPYLAATDPYGHLRTTSQGSQAFSPAFWSALPFDVVNYHDYLMPNRYPTLYDDEANFVYRFAWALRHWDVASYRTGLGLGDGSSWTGGDKPFVWGEIGVGTATWNVPDLDGTTGEGGRRALRNMLWAGLFSPLGTCPIDWYWQSEDAYVDTYKHAERLVASQWFADVDYDGGVLTHLMTSADAPPGYAGETVGSTEADARCYAMRSAAGDRAYAWVQHREHTWFNHATTPTAINPTITIPGMDNGWYAVTATNTRTGATLSSVSLEATGGNLAIPLSGLTADAAIKAVPGVAPVYAGSGTITLPALTAAGVGVFAIAVYSGGGAVTLPPLTATGTGTFTAPVYQGSGALTLPALTATGLGTFAAPIYAGAGTPSLPALTASGAGTFTPPTYAGSGAVTLSALTASGIGTFTPPVYEGAGAASLPALVAAGVGTFAAPVYTGSGAVSLPALVGAGTGAFSATGFVAIVNPQGAWSGGREAAWSGGRRGEWG